ncbi:MAG: HAD family hydrolase, partial [Proteobacteria bacterium]|nr:HAD family hydrolase [Pseudomonadota bacterium]
MSAPASPSGQQRDAPWMRDTIDRLLAQTQSTPSGLSSSDASRRLARDGPNAVRDRRRSVVVDLLSRFLHPLVLMLIAASLLSVATGDVESSAVIISMVALSATLDFVQEHRAARAARALETRAGLRCSVLRDGSWGEVLQEDLVCGDVSRISAGDLIAADGRLLCASDFFVNEALLSGEAFPVEKAPQGTQATGSSQNDLDDIVFKGTAVVSGSATYLVCRTGPQTVLGRLAGALSGRPPPTAFELGTHRFGLLIMRTTAFLTLAVLLVNAALGRPWLESFMFSVALAVGLTPELLPMVVSVTLARGALRMARQRVLVKQLAAIQNLGSMDVLCTDKTGTLTEARVELERHLDARGRESERVLLLAYLNSWFENGIRSPLDEAILAHEHLSTEGWTKIDEVPFDFERRRVSVLIEKDGHRVLIVKGAVEDVLRLSIEAESGGETTPPREGIDGALREQITARFERLGEQGFRVLGIAWREVEANRTHAVVDDERCLVFAGLAAFLDPPKPSAAAALSALASSGVEVRIVTGDNERVTRHVCKQLGIDVGSVLSGDEIGRLDD